MVGGSGEGEVVVVVVVGGWALVTLRWLRVCDNGVSGDLPC